MNYVEEFQRFKNGCIYTIHFDDSGNIEQASINDGESEYDITDGVKDQAYWRKAVANRLYELAVTEDERKRFKQFKEIS